LEKKQLSLNDPRLSSAPSPAKWKRKIDSPVVEDAMSDFIDKILKDFVVDLWYSEITPDKEFPNQIHAIIMDVLAEISARVKEINLVDLLTRDLVDLVGDHLELFRRNQAAIGVDVMKTLSSEERDDRLKFHLLNSKELHPALISPESYSTANECTFSYSTKTTRSTVSCDSLNISGTFDVLGDAACYEFGKPWVYK
jgi:sorting nexin-13